MMANRMDERVTTESRLGTYLKDRRAKLDPAAFGLSPERRRTPGLRREEVAQRANISPTWYTWLEQGRGGAPPADVLDRAPRTELGEGKRRSPVFAARARCVAPHPRHNQDRDLGRRRLESGGDRVVD